MYLLALDLSTTNTGWALFELKSKELKEWGNIKPRVKNPKKKGIPTYSYPEIQLLKIRDIVKQLNELFLRFNLSEIMIEEVCRHKARLTGKVLDGLHFILLDHMAEENRSKITYIDVSEWRKFLNIKLTDLDKEMNKNIRKFNKQTGEKKKVIGWKDLSIRYVQKRFNISDINADVADAICVGCKFLDSMK